MAYELKKTDAQGRAEQRQRELRNDRCTWCDADLDPDFAVDGFCDERCKKLYECCPRMDLSDDEKDMIGELLTRQGWC